MVEEPGSDPCMHRMDCVAEDQASRIELTPVHQRVSRRLQGASPEFGLLPSTPRPAATRIASTTTMATDNITPGQVVFHQPRTPSSFNGDVFEDAEDWLDQYERVAEFNGWDQGRKLRNVYFSLDHSANTWFENHEREMTNWEEFRRKFLATYARNDRREKAEAALHCRIQRPNESVAMYYEDMSRLFRRADPSMAEDKKLRHLMRGVKQELFAGLVRNPPHTVTEFITEASTMERTLEQRARQYDRNQNCASVDMLSAALGSSPDALRELIRSVVREELRLAELAKTSPTFASLEQVVRAEVQQAVQGPVQLDLRPPSTNSTTYAAALQQAAPYAASNFVASTPAVYAAPSNGVITRRQPGNRAAPLAGQATIRKTDVWRAPDRRPLCYHCGEAGHIYRACPYRRVGLRGFAPDAPCPRNGERPAEIQEYLFTQHTSPMSIRREARPGPSNNRSRSPSPHRPSISPGRRSSSPRREN